MNADVGACPAPRRGRDGDWRRVADRRRHLIARQGRRRDPEQDRLLRDIAKSAPPRRAAPGTGAFLEIDLRALRHALHHRRLATRSGAHRNRRSRHSQFRACRSHKGDEHAQPKTKTPGHLPIPSFAAKDMVSKQNSQTCSARAWWSSSLAEIRSRSRRRSHEIFVARHVGPFGPKAGSMRKLSLAVIAPSGNASSGMTSVA